MPRITSALTLFSLLTTVVALPSLTAQPESTDTTQYFSDTSDINRTGTVTVTAVRLRRSDPTVDDAVFRSDIQNTDATDVASVMYEVPAARVQVNSRGESNLYLRNAGERQVSLFFDGALLNVPWDNRVDLSLLPVTAVGGMLVSKGAPSVLYGANTMGGAVNIVTRSLSTDGSRTILEAGAGEHGLLDGSATWLRRSGAWEMFASGSYSRRSGFDVPSGASLDYNQRETELRTNTDSRQAGIFLRGGYLPSDRTEVALSLNLVDAEKGVAPEGHLDARVDRVRFWRYPTWRWGTANLSWKSSWGEYGDTRFQGALWGTAFTQRIDQYEDSTYSSRSASQEDVDRVLGSRMILSHGGETSAISLGMTHVYSTHDQTDSDVDQGTLTSGPLQSYAQYTGSIGPEYRTSLSDDIDLTAGLSLDLMATIDAADKPAQDPFVEPGLTLAGTWRTSELTTFGLSLGRKSRFPSMRELYGEALNRFLVNPELTPESSISIETDVAHAFRIGEIDGNFTVTGFAQLVDNTIDQRSVTVDSTRLRQRYNLPGSSVYGFELRGRLEPTDRLNVNGHLTWTHARTDEPLENGGSYLSEKPEWLGTLNLRAELPWSLRMDFEALYLGTAYTLDDSNEFVSLGASTTLNTRLSWVRPGFGPTELFEIYGRINNLLDESTFNQLGLPGPGREARAGIRVTL